MTLILPVVKQGNKWVSKTHTTNAWVQLKLCEPPPPPFKGNISVADCSMPPSSLLKTMKINGDVQCRRYIKIGILDSASDVSTDDATRMPLYHASVEMFITFLESSRRSDVKL